jgi:hypothetical protein
VDGVDPSPQDVVARFPHAEQRARMCEILPMISEFESAGVKCLFMSLSRAGTDRWRCCNTSE